MPVSSSPEAVASRIQSLLDERKKYAESIARIDQALQGVSAAIEVSHAPVSSGRRGRPKGSLNKGAMGEMSSFTGSSAPAGKRGKRRRRFAMSGEEAVINFIRDNKSPTTQEINAFWRSEGRGGSADNALTKLTKNGTLQREALEGRRGSRYNVR